MEIKTLTDIYAVTCELERDAAMMYKKNDRWEKITVPEFRDTVRWFSTGLRVLGVKPGDRVAILSEHRPEWTIGDFAILCAGAVTVPVYPTLLPHQIEYVLKDSNSVLVLCSTEEQMKKIIEIKPHCPSVHNILVCDPPPRLPEGVLTFQQIVEDGKKEEAASGRARFDELRTSRKPDDLATLVYTSGTTGDPKGAMLSHGNIGSNVNAVTKVLKLQQGWVALSILPLSHILERTADFAYLSMGGTVAYAENVNKVRDNLPEVRPDVFAAVPRLFEKMRIGLMDKIAAQTPMKQKVAYWALKIAAERLPYRIDPEKKMPLGLAIRSKIAEKAFFSKIMHGLGGRVKYVLSGGAPLSPELAAFFIGAGLEILEGYGLTETSPVIAVNSPERRRIGTVGPLIPGVEVRIAEDGEILTRGPHVMQGYWNKPEATSQAIDPDGWFHTGDIGELDRDGYLKITDRKKDIIINAYGKNIAPQPLENDLKSSPYIATPVILGDRRKFLTALLIPNFEKLERDVAAQGVAWNTREELVSHPKVQALFQTEIDKFNRNLDRQEKIRRFTLLPNDFTIDNDEITPSLKVKRKVIDKKYKDVIDAMYIDENVEEEKERARA